MEYRTTRLTIKRVHERAVPRFDRQDLRSADQERLVPDQGRSTNVPGPISRPIDIVLRGVYDSRVNPDKLEHSCSLQERLDRPQCIGKVKGARIDVGSVATEGLGYRL